MRSARVPAACTGAWVVQRVSVGAERQMPGQRVNYGHDYSDRLRRTLAALHPQPVGALEEGGPAHGGVADAFVGPDYSPAPEIAGAASAARGTVTTMTMSSASSKIYPGVDRKDPVEGADSELYDSRFRGLGCTLTSFGQPEFDTDEWVGHGHGGEHHGHPMNADASTPDLFKPGVQPYERAVVVYTPAGLDPSDPAPFIVVNDGGSYVEDMVPTLDSLIAAGRIPSNLCALFVDSGGSDAQGSQRGLEYDTVDGTFAEFCDTEVKPFVEDACGITLTSDPEGRAAMGGSSGGCAAFTMAWTRPDLFRRVLTYSGTYVNQQYPYNPELPGGCWEYHAGQELIAHAEKKPLKVLLFNTELDIGYDLPERTMHNWTRANTRMATILKAKGYNCRHVFCRDAGHVDRRAVASTLAGGLVWLWEGYQGFSPV